MMEGQRVGGGIRRASRIKIRIERYGRRGELGHPWKRQIEEQRTRERTRSPPLIELIFCLGSIWAYLELAFLASVNYYSIVSIRSSLLQTFRSRMD